MEEQKVEVQEEEEEEGLRASLTPPARHPETPPISQPNAAAPACGKPGAPSGSGGPGRARPSPAALGRRSGFDPAVQPSRPSPPRPQTPGTDSGYSGGPLNPQILFFFFFFKMPFLAFNTSYYLCDCCFLSPPADPSECAPLTPSDPSTSGSLACKRKYHTDSETVVSFESRGLSKDPIPGPVVTGPAPVARGPGPVGPGPGPVALGPGPVGPGPGLRVGAGPELLHHSVGAQGPAGEGSEEDLTGLGVGRTHEDVGTHMDVEDKDQKESKRKEKLYQIATELLMTERAYVVRLHLLDQV